MLNPGIFKEYDLRGLADVDFAEQPLLQLTYALGAYFHEHGCNDVLVGRDCRLSSPRIRQTVVDILSKMGMRVVDVGMVTTPMFYFAREHLKLNAGLMITASHNPPRDNGMKIALGPATIHGEEIQNIRRLAKSIDLEQVAAATISEAQPEVTYIDVAEAYAADLAQRLRLGERKLKVVVDCGNGSAGPITARFLDAMEVDYVPLFMEPDGRFPNHEADPVKSKNLEQLRVAVLREQADLGVGFDGDGDRIGVVDEKGNIIWGDSLMILYWQEILAKHPGSRCLIEVKCSQALEDAIKGFGGIPEWCRTGHSLIKARMREIGAKFAGEMSGHMFFADEYYGFDDALYAFGRLLRILSQTDKPLSALFEGIPKYYSTAETRIACPDELKFKIVEDVKSVLAEDYRVIDVDGVRVLFADGWGLFRASNTQPAIVGRCETKSPETLEKVKRLLHDLLVKQGIAPFEWAE